MEDINCNIWSENVFLEYNKWFGYVLCLYIEMLFLIFIYMLYVNGVYILVLVIFYFIGV